MKLLLLDNVEARLGLELPDPSGAPPAPLLALPLALEQPDVLPLLEALPWPPEALALPVVALLRLPAGLPEEL